MQKILPAGKYFIGDPIPILEKLNVDIDYFFKSNMFFQIDCFSNFQKLKLPDGDVVKDVYIMECRFGLKPRILKDNFGFKYKNSNGVIGLLPYRIMENTTDFSHGRVLEFKSEFSVSVFDGVLSFSNIKIDTNGS